MKHLWEMEHPYYCNNSNYFDGENRKHSAKETPMRCGRADCNAEGCWIPTLLLHAKDSPKAFPAARFQVSTVVCDEHKTTNAEHFITDDAWKAFLAWFDERGAQRPHRSLSTIEYTPYERAIIAPVH